MKVSISIGVDFINFEFGKHCFKKGKVLHRMHEQIFTAAIIEDEVSARESLSYLLMMAFPNIRIISESSDFQEVVRIINSEPVNIIFLDINLGKINGFDILDALGKHNTKVIFVTAYEEYAIKAIKYRAAGYLLKPVALGDLIETVNAALEDQAKSTEPVKNVSKDNPVKHLSISDRTKIQLLALTDVSYLHADGSYTAIYLSTGQKYVTSKRLGFYEEELCGKSSFFRVHKSYIINFDHVDYLDKSNHVALLKNGEAIPCSIDFSELLQSASTRI